MKRTVDVTISVEVETDDSIFTPEFLEDFRSYMYPFQNIEDHVKHLAQLEARGLLSGFVEGYGSLKMCGVNAKTVSTEMEIVSIENKNT